MCLVNGKFIPNFQYSADKVMKNLNDVEALMSLFDLLAKLKKVGGGGLILVIIMLLSAW